MQTEPIRKENSWTKRFIVAAIIQGAIIVGLTAFIVMGDGLGVNVPQVSRVIAGGGAGTWFAFGYVMYVVVGVIGVAVSALFYHYLEQNMQRYYRGKLSRVLAWIHLILMNVGSSIAMGMMMYVGYVGGGSMLSESVGGKGFDAEHAHLLMGPFVNPIGMAILVILAGVLAGGLGFVLVYRQRTTTLDRSLDEMSKKH